MGNPDNPPTLFFPIYRRRGAGVSPLRRQDICEGLSIN